MAEVFEATLLGAEGFSRPVAIKRMLPSLSADPAFGAMFVNEARLASLLTHPSIGSTLDFDRDDEGRYFLVMELINGIDLRALAQSGRLPVSISVHIAAELLRGLDYAHELVHDGRHLRIVHRDVSPHNVMVSFSGGVKLVDFGIAKAVAATGASRSGSLKGKVAYMSPEQAHGHELDGRADVFAVGVILHELLCGQRLFAGATEPEVLARLLTQPISRPSEIARDVAPDLDAAVMSMLARDPAYRASSAHAALEQLLQCTAINPRAGLALRDLLAERFPERAPTRGGSGANTTAPPPAFVATSSQHGPAAPYTATVTAGSHVGAPSNFGALSQAGPATSPTAGANAVAAPMVGAAPRRSQRWLLLAAAAISVIAVAAALVIRAGRADDSVAAGDPVDAGSPLDAPTNTPANERASDAAVSVPDAATPTVDAASASASREVKNSETESTTSKRERDRQAERERKKKAERDGAIAKAREQESKNDEKGEVLFTADPWATVSVAGKSYGRTPQRVSFSVGTYKATFSNSELGKSVRRSFTVRAKRTTRVSATLK